MADKKISALPAATTPLAGTEVLPIVQGGTTDQVSVANLTAGRAVGALSVTTTQDVTTGRNIVVTGAGTIEQNGAAGGLYFRNSAVSGGATNQRFYTTNASGAAQIQLQLNGGTTPTNQVYGDLIAETGNFKISTAGKGITTGSATALGLGVNGSVSAVTIDTSNNLLVGAATSAGGATNTAKVVGGIFSTASGTASTTSGSAATMFTANGTDNEVYIVSAAVPAGAPALYVTSYLVTCGASTLSATAIQAASNISISVSGLNVRVTQISGAPQNVVWTAIRVS